MLYNIQLLAIFVLPLRNNYRQAAKYTYLLTFFIYYCRWPPKKEGVGSEHLIISEVGPTRLDRYVSRLEGEIEEFMSETVTKCVEEDGEITQQTIKETQTFIIRGVVDPRTNEEVCRPTPIDGASLSMTITT